MYCNRCGKPMNPDYRGICPACKVYEYNVNTSFADFKADQDRAIKKQKKDEKRTKTIVFISGFFCPLIWIIYLISKNWSSIEKWAMSSSRSSYSGGSSSYSVGSSGGSDISSFDESPSERKFIFTGGDGNLYESGGLFRDWAGDLVEWGKPFHDARGNLVEWGNPFYDNRNNLTSWGSPFYDAGGNLINPRG